MNTFRILCPRCPLCDQRSTMIISAVQVFCTNDACRAMCWDATQTALWNMENATMHDLSGLYGVPGQAQ